MKYLLTSFGISALLHAALWLAVMPLLLWQDKLALPEAQPKVVPLSLAQFQPAPPPKPIVPIVPASVVKPEPPPQPVEKPKPKPKPEKKPVEKKLPAKTKPKPDEPLKPAVPAAQPVVTSPPVSVPVSVPPAVAVQPKPAPVAPVPMVDNAAAEAAYRQKLQNLIGARKQYPRQAERAEIEGTVTVAFTALPNGTLTNVRVSQSSGNEWLDKAALQAVSASSGTLPFPATIRKARWDFTLKVNFRLD